MPDQKALVKSVRAEHTWTVMKRAQKPPGWLDKSFVSVQMSLKIGWHDSAPDSAVYYLDHGYPLAGRRWNGGTNCRDPYLLAGEVEVCYLQYMSSQTILDPS